MHKTNNKAWTSAPHLKQGLLHNLVYLQADRLFLLRKKADRLDLIISLLELSTNPHNASIHQETTMEFLLHILTSHHD